MIDILDGLIKQLKPFDLEPDVTTVYLYILENGSADIKAISDHCYLPRPESQLACEKLVTLKLIENKHGLYQSTSYQRLIYSLKQKIDQIVVLEKSIPLLYDRLLSRYFSQNNLKFRYFEGIEGLKQLIVNTTKNRGIIRHLESNNPDILLDFNFCEYINRRLTKSRLKSYHRLTNSSVISTWTDVTQLTKLIECRHISPENICIVNEAFIYDDTVALYQQVNHKIVALEVRDAYIADIQKKFFDFIWNQAQPMQSRNPHGMLVV